MLLGATSWTNCPRLISKFEAKVQLIKGDKTPPHTLRFCDFLEFGKKSKTLHLCVHVLANLTVAPRPSSVVIKQCKHTRNVFRVSVYVYTANDDHR